MVSAPPSALRSMLSTSFRSMTMLPMLRVKRTRPPLAEISKISATLLPLNSIVSVPSWPSTVSLPSPGSHWNTSSPAPRQRRVVALLAVDEVVAVAAEQLVVAVAAEDGVVAGAAVDGELISAARLPVALRAVVAAVHVDDEVLGRADVEEERRRDRGGRSARACRWRWR